VNRPLVVVDNTFLGPFAQRPIEIGVDLNMTSLTKYCAGHSDLLAGGVSGKAELIEKLRFQRVVWGSALDPFTAWLLLRSMESVAVRTERAMENARAVAEWLRDHPKVAGVTYLGFLPEGSRQREVFDRQCTAAGSTFSFHAPRRRGGGLPHARQAEAVAAGGEPGRIGNADLPFGQHHTLCRCAREKAGRRHHRWDHAALGRAGTQGRSDRRSGIRHWRRYDAHRIDPHAIDGKFPFSCHALRRGGGGGRAQRHGSGVLTAAQAGQSVLLVDENPVPGHQIGNDVPYYFGGRATAATQNSERMLETLFMNTPDLEAVIEAGVELLLGTCAWGVYRNGPLVGSLPGQVVALADGERSWLVGFDRLVLATGARDLPMAFPGWNQPGVMGAAALKMLLTRYDAFAGQAHADCRIA
jgi:hypothetical protein